MFGGAASKASNAWGGMASKISAGAEAASLAAANANTKV